MLYHLPRPRDTPALSDILDDIGNPAPEALAAALGVHVEDVRRWIEADQAPRLVLAALWWLTSWGRSTVDSHADTVAKHAAAEARILRRQLDEERTRMHRVWRLADFGSANAPTVTAAGLGGAPLAVQPAPQLRRLADQPRGQDGPADDQHGLAHDARPQLHRPAPLLA